MATQSQYVVQAIDAVSFTVGIVSLVVGLTSLLLAGFSAWLSWQFFKSSQTQNDRTQESVSRIEGTVTMVNTNISQIVDRAISAWSKSEKSSEEEAIASDVVDSYEDLRRKLESLENDKKSDDGWRAEFGNILSENQRQVENLLSTIRESRIRSVFSTSEPAAINAAVTIVKKLEKSDEDSEEGEISLLVSRPGRVITGTVHLERDGFSGGGVKLSLESAPEGGEGVRIRSGFTGENLNIHLHGAGGSPVLPGKYLMRYTVQRV